LLKLVVTKGAPLPFAFDILTPAHQYGNRAFVQYPADIPDYFKQTFPEGFSWERSIIFEDRPCAQQPATLGEKYIEDITRWREDMNFMFEWQQQYLRSYRQENKIHIFELTSNFFIIWAIIYVVEIKTELSLIQIPSLIQNYKIPGAQTRKRFNTVS